VLAQDDTVENDTDLTLLLLAADVSGMTEMELGERVESSSASGVMPNPYKLASSWTGNKINDIYERNYTHTKPISPSSQSPISTNNASSAKSCPGLEEMVYGLKFGSMHQ